MDKKNSRLYRRLLHIVSIPSVSPSSIEENRIARALYDEMANTAYFTENPGDLRLLPIEGDPLERHIVFGIVRAPRKTEKTVILMGHMDVVSVEMFGALKDLAFDAEAYTSRIDPQSMGEDGKRDLLSGEWLFGRGVADMKSGVCGAMELLLEAGKDPSGMKTNLAVLFVPDEENNSGGMLGAVPWLAKFQDDGLDFVCCIDTEPTFATGEEAKPTVYLGSLGKINPFFLCLGIKAHAGEYYDGFSVGPTMARISIAIDGNLAMADSLGDTVYPPFAALKIDDMRREYSATILSRCAMAYSYLTSSKMPTEILAGLREIARKALSESIEEHNANRLKYRERNGLPLSVNNLKAKTYSVKEIITMAELKGVPLPEVTTEGDERTRALAFISSIVENLELEGPLVVVGFLPPWYPHRANRDDLPQDALPREAAKALQIEAKKRGIEIKIRDMFEGVSDLSYCGFTEDPMEARTFDENMPGGKSLYRFPTEDLLRLSIPVINFGTVGKDPHKRTERIHLPFYLDSYIDFLRHLVKFFD